MDISLVLTVDAKTGTATLKQVGDSLDQVDAKAKKAQGGLGGLSGTLSGLARDFQSALSSGLGLGAGFAVGQKAAEALAGAITGIPAALAAATKAWLDHGGSLVDVNARTQIAIENFQKLDYAAGISGIKQDELTGSIEKMKRSLVDAPEKFAALGLSAARLKDAAPDEAFRKILATIDAIPNSAERSAAAMEIFGKSGSVLLQMAGDMETASDRAEHLGFVMDTETAQAADALGDELDTLGKSWQGLLENMVGAVAKQPEVLEFFVGITEAVGALSVAIKNNAKEIGAWAVAAAAMSPGGQLFQLARAVGHNLSGNPTIKTPTGFGAEAPSMDDELARMQALGIAMAGELDRVGQAELKKAGDRAAKAWEVAFKERVQGYITDGRDIGASFAAWGEFWGQRAAEGLQTAWEKYGMQGGPDIGDRFLQDQFGWFEESAHLAEQATIDWGEAVSGVGDAFAQLGSMAGGVLGGIFSALGKLIPLFQSMGKSLGGNISGAVGIGGVVGSLAGGAAGVGAGIGALGASTILPMIGSVLGPIGTIGGALAGGLIGKLFGGLFGGSKKPEVIPPTWEEKFKTAADAVEKFGLAAGRGIQGLLGTAGNRRPEAQAFVNQQLGRATGAMGAIGGLDITSAAGAAAQATIFTTTFWAVVKEQGLVAGVDALAAPFAALKEKLSAGGFDVAALLGGVGGLFDAVEGPARAALEAADGLNQALQGVALAGYLTQDSFAAFGQSAQDAFNQALAGNLDSNQALLAIAPLLANIEEASRTYGLTIDANTQALIDQARNAGIAFPVDPIERAALAMERVAEHLERIYGLSENVGSSFGNWAVPGGSGGGVPSYHDPDYSAASGMYSPSLPRTSRPDGASMIMAHPGEEVSIRPAGRRGGGTTINVPISVTATGGIDRAALQREMAEDIRREKVPELLNRITERVMLRLRVA